uniref:Ig-like domain-containing protein n=1 Tax=Romanomermis culicivorax TaxID=13658 RepID=A0A915LB96_ROMCU
MDESIFISMDEPNRAGVTQSQISDVSEEYHYFASESDLSPFIPAAWTSTQAIGGSQENAYSSLTAHMQQSCSSGGFPSHTTTISTIVVKAGDVARLTLAVLRISDFVQIRVDEMIPSFLDIGQNLAEAIHLRDQHSILLQKLAAKEPDVKGLFAKADRIAAEKQAEGPSGIVYQAMVMSLDSAWRDLNEQLRHYQLIRKLEEFMELIRSSGWTTSPEQQIETCNEFRRHLLDASLDVMSSGQSTIERLRQIGSFVDDVETIKEVLTMCTNIEGKMIRCNEARKAIEQVSDQLKLDLEFGHQLWSVRADIETIEHWLTNNADLFSNRNLGDTEVEARILSEQNSKALEECKDFFEILNKVISILNQFSNIKRDEASRLYECSYQIKIKLDQVLVFLETRRQMLYMAVKFFQEGSGALSELEGIERKLKSMSLSRHRDIMVKQHAEFSALVHSSTQGALAQGRSLLQRVGSDAAEVQGVQKMLFDIERRVVEVDNLCTAHRMNAAKRGQKFIEFEEMYENLFKWLVRYGEAFLHANGDMGTTEFAVAEFLNGHRELLDSINEKIKTDVRQITIWMQTNLSQMYFDDNEKKEICTKHSEIAERFEKLRKILQNRIKLGELYARCHKSASQLSSDLDIIEAVIRTSREFEDSDSKSRFDETWRIITDDFNELRHKIDQFCAHTSLPSVQDRSLDSRSAYTCVQHRFEYLQNRYHQTNRQYVEFCAKIEKLSELNGQWKIFVEECIKVIASVDELQREATQAFSKLDQTSNISVEKQKIFLDEFGHKTQSILRQLENCMQTAEILAVHVGETSREKEALVDELLKKHQHVQRTFGQMEVLMSMILTFFMNLQQVDEWMNKITQTFTVERIKQDKKHTHKIFQEYRAACQTVDEFLRFAQSESEQIIRRCRQSDIDARIRDECETTSSLIENRVKKWESIRSDQLPKLEKLNSFVRMENYISETIEAIGTLTTEIRKSSVDVTLSPEAKKLAEIEFQQLKQKIEETESIIRKSVESYEHALPKKIENLKKRWKEFKDELIEIEKKIQISTNYWLLVEEIEYWSREVTEYIVEIGKTTPLLRTAQESEKLAQDVQKYFENVEKEQEKRIVELVKIAEPLYGELADQKMQSHKRRFKEIVDTMHMVINQLHSLVETFETTEEKSREMLRIKSSEYSVPQKPQFTSTLMDMEVNEGARVELSCTVASQPRPQITWFKDNMLVEGISDYKTVYSGNQCTLIIEETFADDSAVYKCRALNEFGVDQTEARLSVRG